MALVLYTPPTREPVSLYDAKLHLRVDIDDDDTLILALIKTATQYVEQICRPRRALISQKWLYLADEFPAGDIELRVVPVTAVDWIKYTDEDGSTATVSASDYVVDTYSQPARIRLKSTASWPTVTLQEINGFQVLFTAGETAVPEPIRQAILLLVGHWFENREAVQVTGAVPKELDLAVSSLLTPYRGDRRGVV